MVVQFLVCFGISILVSKRLGQSTFLPTVNESLSTFICTGINCSCSLWSVLVSVTAFLLISPRYVATYNENNNLNYSEGGIFQHGDPFDPRCFVFYVFLAAYMVRFKAILPSAFRAFVNGVPRASFCFKGMKKQRWEFTSNVFWLKSLATWVNSRLCLLPGAFDILGAFQCSQDY